jgi:broad specificity phosphatase PhoE
MVKRERARLGEHLLSQGIRFRAAYVGALVRQGQTLEAVRQAYVNASIPFPAAHLDPGWNEFDLSHIYRKIAPQLSADGPEFRREYEELLEQIRISRGAHAAAIHRKWLPCDTTIVNAWISGSYKYDGETWEQFRQRIRLAA